MSVKKEWFRNWFDKDYLDLYAHRDEADALTQLDLIRRQIPGLEGKQVLDLGCGDGRHLEIMTAWGWKAVGIDLSQTLLREAQNRSAFLSIIQADMRLIPGRFDLILSLFTSFGYFETDEQNQTVFNEIASVLLPGGMFWLDFLNPEYVCAHLRKNEVLHSQSGQKVLVRRRLEQGRVIKEIEMGCRSVTESVCLYDLETLREMAEVSGFVERALFGDYLGGEHGSESPRTILLLEKMG